MQELYICAPYTYTCSVCHKSKVHCTCTSPWPCQVNAPTLYLSFSVHNLSKSASRLLVQSRDKALKFAIITLLFTCYDMLVIKHTPPNDSRMFTKYLCIHFVCFFLQISCYFYLHFNRSLFAYFFVLVGFHMQLCRSDANQRSIGLWWSDIVWNILRGILRLLRGLQVMFFQ